MEAQRRWRKSTRSGSTSDCVEVSRSEGQAGIRDSKRPGPELAFTPGGMDAFLAAIRGGNFDRR
ncbi:hypothetical protein GCM10022243_48580 [Saccharothrix violaceirubra]|uniref:DUF397 domain-containing protein n=1 Tax=Saccharothrix violaceirubra TaxID=413306 RepID=UPI001619AA7C|nr:DUF397 domain-containing protein [Saccharothrix violaceirubra]